MNRPTWLKWIRECQADPHSPAEFPGAIGMLTGQDFRVLDAVADCWLLYAVGDAAGERAALESVRALLPAMQPQCRPFARELIAWAMDWHDRELLWPRVAGGPS
jgi:hypothetical protein